MREFILAMIGLGISITEVVGRDSGGSNLGPTSGGGSPAPDDTTSANEYLIFFI